MKAPDYRKSWSTIIATELEKLIGINIRNTNKTTKHYPYENSIENRWGVMDVLFGPIEREIYQQFITLKQQAHGATRWQLKKIELTIDTAQSDRVLNRLKDEFDYRSATHFNQIEFNKMLDKNVFSLNCYQNVEIFADPNIEFVIHQESRQNAHLLDEQRINVYRVVVDLQMLTAGSKPNVDTSFGGTYPHTTATQGKSVQLQIYDEKSSRTMTIERFPIILGHKHDNLIGKFVSGENIRLDFDENDELIIENISYTNSIYINNVKLDIQQDGKQPSKHKVAKRDNIHIAKIVHHDDEYRHYPRIEVLDIQNGKNQEHIGTRRKTPKATPYHTDSVRATKYAEPPRTAPVTQYNDTLFKVIIQVGEQEVCAVGLNSTQLPCLVGRLNRLESDMPYRALVTVPSHQENQAGYNTVSRQHLVIEKFEDNTARIKVLGSNGCAINGDKYVDTTIYVPANETVLLGKDKTPVTMILVQA